MEAKVALAGHAGRYEGLGINHEGQSFQGHFSLRPCIQGKGFEVSFVARGAGGEVFHEEMSLIAANETGVLVLWNFNSNSPALLAHEIRDVRELPGRVQLVFGFQDKLDSSCFREEVVLDLWRNGDLGYTYFWGLPGGAFAERSGVTMKRLAPPSSPFANAGELDLPQTLT